jgi:hypothetical protein
MTDGFKLSPREKNAKPESSGVQDGHERSCQYPGDARRLILPDGLGSDICSALQQRSVVFSLCISEMTGFWRTTENACAFTLVERY